MVFSKNLYSINILIRPNFVLIIGTFDAPDARQVQRNRVKLIMKLELHLAQHMAENYTEAPVELIQFAETKNRRK